MDIATIAEMVIVGPLSSKANLLAMKNRLDQMLSHETWVHNLLGGCPFVTSDHIQKLSKGLDQLIAMHHTQQGGHSNDREWNRSAAVRFPAIDAALVILDACDKLTDELREIAFYDVSPWDRFEGFTVGGFEDFE
jgi:hypothetical protein